MILRKMRCHLSLVIRKYGTVEKISFGCAAAEESGRERIGRFGILKSTWRCYGVVTDTCQCNELTTNLLIARYSPCQLLVQYYPRFRTMRILHNFRLDLPDVPTIDAIFPMYQKLKPASPSPSSPLSNTGSWREPAVAPARRIQLASFTMCYLSI